MSDSCAYGSFTPCLPATQLKLYTSIESGVTGAAIPTEDLIHSWVWHSIRSLPCFDNSAHYEISLSVVDAPTIQALNRDYRNKDTATNVLSFPSGMPPIPATEDASGLCALGDIVACQSVIEVEANTQGKSIEQHWAHMLVHSVLHLFGYDHIHPDEARVMETLEVEILKCLSVSNPYQLPFQNS